MISQSPENGPKPGIPYENADHKQAEMALQASEARCKNAEKALSESEQQLRFLSENLAEGMVYQIDSGLDGQQRKFTYISPAVERLHGLTVEAVQLNPLLLYGQVLEEFRPLVAQQEAIAYQTKKPLDVEVLVQLPSGELRWRHFISAPRTQPNGNTVWDGIELDITEKQKLLEAAHKTQKLEALGVLAGGIAHDFNNLLSGIYGYIDLAYGSTQDANVTEYLREAMETIDRARSLTQQLLTFAKGGAPIRKVEPLFPFLKDVANFALRGSNIFCKFDIESNLWWCNHDKHQLSQVVSNIVINAQQAMPMGGCLKISAANIILADKEHVSLPAGKYARITIADKGIGIPKEILPRIFEPFFTTKQKGSGLGLAVSYSIVNQHGGCIDVESEPGHGSTFRVFLPATDEFMLPENQPPANKHQGSGRILIMDDEAVIRQITSAMLARLGYSFVCTCHGEEALQTFINEKEAGRPFTAIILDLTVPGGMGGKETALAIRQFDKNIPLFVVSGYSQDPVIANPQEYGFTASICKPFKMAELAKLLEQIV